MDRRRGRGIGCICRRSLNARSRDRGFEDKRNLTTHLSVQLNIAKFG
jgi:hypothetical protein